MICPERKSIEPIALNVGNGNVSAMRDREKTLQCDGKVPSFAPGTSPSG